MADKKEKVTRPEQQNPNEIVENLKAKLWQEVNKTGLPSSVIKLTLENMVYQIQVLEMQEQIQMKSKGGV